MMYIRERFAASDDVERDVKLVLAAIAAGQYERVNDPDDGDVVEVWYERDCRRVVAIPLELWESHQDSR